MNSTKHGLLASVVRLPDEDAEELADFAERMRGNLKPDGEAQSLLVDLIVRAAWRLRRAQVMENDILAYHRGRGPAGETPSLGMGFLRDVQGHAPTLDNLSRYEAGLERSLFRALDKLRELKAAKAGRSAAGGAGA